MLRVLKIAHNNRIGVNALRSLSLALEKPSCNLLHLDISGCRKKRTLSLLSLSHPFVLSFFLLQNCGTEVLSRWLVGLLRTCHSCHLTLLITRSALVRVCFSKHIHQYVILFFEVRVPFDEEKSLCFSSLFPGNKLNDAFAFELLRFLEHNRSLESIDVCENKFTEVGRAFLSQLARRSISLQSIFTTDEQKQQLVQTNHEYFSLTSTDRLFFCPG